MQPKNRPRAVGLCGQCRHARVIVSARASEFWLCQRASREPERFAKYPPLPVLRCAGWEAGTPTGG